MLSIKFNVKTPKCEFSNAATATSALELALRYVDTFKTLRQKINETDINIRQRYTWEPNAFNCTFLTLFLAIALHGCFRETERERVRGKVRESSTCSCRLQFFHLFHFSLFRKIHTQENSIEMAFRKILIAFARYARCRNNENYDKLRNLWCCSVCLVQFAGRWRKGIKIFLNLFIANPSPNVSPERSFSLLLFTFRKEAKEKKTCF